MNTYCGRNSGRAARCMVALAAVTVFLMVGSRTMGQSENTSSKASEAQAANAENGKKLFAKYGCYECHGREAQGGGLNGPRLAPDPMPFPFVVSYVRHPLAEMPPYTDKVLSDKDLTDIYAFLQSRPQPPSTKTIPILKH
ncbi:MAG: cytochrome c [Acidobacteriia bacterium]|nr:cytochrome c [Terriglobia bacterium]